MNLNTSSPSRSAREHHTGNGILRICRLMALLLSLLAWGAMAKTSIAVIQFEGSLEKHELATLTDRFISTLSHTSEYLVLERSQMDQILKEQGFQQSGCTSSDCAVEVGQLLGVQSMIAGNIGKLGRIYSLSVRMIEVSTGHITASAALDVKGSIEEVLQQGIPQIMEQLLSPEKAQNKKVKSTINGRRIVGISCAALGGAAAAGAGFFFYQKMHNHSLYRDATAKDDMDFYFQKETNAYYAGLGTAAVSAVLVPTAILLLRGSGKSKVSDEDRTSLRIDLLPDGLALVVHF